MAKLFVMVGLPGSGKSTCAEQLKTIYQAKILSSDEYRKKLFGDENDQTHNAEVFEALYADMREFIKQDVSVCIDATNTTLKARKRIFDELKGVKPARVIAWVIAPPIELCVDRDSRRERHVGIDVIRKFELSFQFPQKFEGFDEIWLGEFNCGGLKLAPEFNGPAFWTIQRVMGNFNQHNPHHKYTLGQHCVKLARYYKSFEPEYYAGLMHDIGKLITMSIDENGIAHYYNHDSVGTYFLISNADLLGFTNKGWDFIYEVLFFINYHMRAHNDFKSQKAARKYRKLFGDSLYDRLIRFGEYDKMASGTYEEHEEIKNGIQNNQRTTS